MKMQESAQDYLESILILSQQKDYVRATDICNYFGYARATVSVFMKQLKEKRVSVSLPSLRIDSVLKEAYMGTTLMNDHMIGEFPVLVPGVNGISWTGSVSQVVIQPNWRFL